MFSPQFLMKVVSAIWVNDAEGVNYVVVIGSIYRSSTKDMTQGKTLDQGRSQSKTQAHARFFAGEGGGCFSRDYFPKNT